MVVVAAAVAVVVVGRDGSDSTDVPGAGPDATRPERSAAQVGGTRAGPVSAGAPPVASDLDTALVIPGESAPEYAPRLTDPVVERWSTPVASAVADRSIDLLVDADVVVLTVPRVDIPTAGQVIGLDPVDGGERWRFPVRDVTSTRLVAVVDGVVTIDTGEAAARSGSSTSLGIDAATGRIAWERADPEHTALVPLLGTPFLALEETSAAGEASTAEEASAAAGSPAVGAGAVRPLIDGSTGDPVGELVGEVVATDGRGVWFATDGDVLRRYDLTVGFRPSTTAARLDGLAPEGRNALTVVGGMPVTAVGDRPVTVVDGELSRVLSDGTVQRLDLVAAPGAGAVPDRVDRIVQVDPVVGDALVFTTDQSIVGAVLRDDEVELRWQRPGAVLATSQTDRGGVLIVGLEGGLDFVAVDAVTGATVDAIDE